MNKQNKLKPSECQIAKDEWLVKQINETTIVKLLYRKKENFQLEVGMLNDKFCR